jgi:hypothetical protein
MYTIECEEEFFTAEKVTIQPGEPLLNAYGEEHQEEQFDENGDPVLDENGDTIMLTLLNDLDHEVVTLIDKTEETKQAEIDAAVEAKRVEIQAEVDAYVAAQQYQLENGGSGPSASFDVMKIVNEHDGEFEVEFTGRHI